MSVLSYERMSVRKPAESSLTVRQKLTLFHGSGLNAEQALSTPDDQLGFDMLLSNGVKALNITAAGVRPLALKQLGVLNASQLRRLGFDALHLVDPVWCQESSAAFGAADVIATFLQTPSDAVALAGSDAMTTLDLSVQQLLEVCAGAPTEALSVLKQVTALTPLSGVNATTLLDAGIRAPQLQQLGYNVAAAQQLSGLGPAELQKLGFRL